MTIICLICGDEGIVAALDLCLKCQLYGCHRYCREILPGVSLKDNKWLCEDCDFLDAKLCTADNFCSLTSPISVEIEKGAKQSHSLSKTPTSSEEHPGENWTHSELAWLEDEDDDDGGDGNECVDQNHKKRRLVAEDEDDGGDDIDGNECVDQNHKKRRLVAEDEDEEENEEDEDEEEDEEDRSALEDDKAKPLGTSSVCVYGVKPLNITQQEDTNADNEPQCTEYCAKGSKGIVEDCETECIEKCDRDDQPVETSPSVLSNDATASNMSQQKLVSISRSGTNCDRDQKLFGKRRFTGKKKFLNLSKKKVYSRLVAKAEVKTFKKDKCMQDQKNHSSISQEKVIACYEDTIQRKKLKKPRLAPKEDKVEPMETFQHTLKENIITGGSDTNLGKQKQFRIEFEEDKALEKTSRFCYSGRKNKLFHESSYNKKFSDGFKPKNREWHIKNCFHHQKQWRERRPAHYEGEIRAYLNMSRHRVASMRRSYKEDEPLRVRYRGTSDESPHQRDIYEIDRPSNFENNRHTFEPSTRSPLRVRYRETSDESPRRRDIHRIDRPSGFEKKGRSFEPSSRSPLRIRYRGTPDESSHRRDNHRIDRPSTFENKGRNLEFSPRSPLRVRYRGTSDESPHRRDNRRIDRPSNFEKNGHNLEPSPTSPLGFDSPKLTPMVDPIWRGILGVPDWICRLVEADAHLSISANVEAFKVAEMFPSCVSLKLFSRSDLWPNCFHASGPTPHHIALYFFPPSQRSRYGFDKLIDKMVDRDLALLAVFENEELVVFTSHVLPRNCQTFESGYFLWGGFRTRRPSVLTDHIKPQPYK